LEDRHDKSSFAANIKGFWAPKRMERMKRIPPQQ